MDIKKIILTIIFSSLGFSTYAMNLKNSAIEVKSLPTLNICQQKTRYMKCEASQNNRIVRQMTYLNDKLRLVNVYYKSGNLAKNIYFNENEQLSSVNVYADEAYPSIDKNSSGYMLIAKYYIIFKNGKFHSVLDNPTWNFVTLSWTCEEVNQHQCDELKFFKSSTEPDLHPALSLPVENKGLNILEMNGINIPNLRF